MSSQTVIDALISQLKEITVANGFNTDIGNNVQSFYELDIEKDELPIVNVREKPGANIPQTAGPEWQHDCQVEIVVLVNVTTDTMEYIRKAKNDVLAAIKADLTLGDTCMNISLDSHDLELREEDTTYAGAVVNLTLQYITDEWEV